MSTNLEEYLNERKKSKDLLLMTHVICGYPSFEDNWQELEVMEAAGVDVVELQFPFSEPSADGPVFVRANEISLKNGTTVDQCFEFLKKASEHFSFKTLMMGYYNTAYKMGHETYVKRLKEAGGSGFILPDLPIEESAELHGLAADNGLSPIMLMTPTNSQERLNEIGTHASGFVYAVARKGVTGNKTAMGEEIDEYLACVRKATSVPVAVGFGISSKEDIDFLRGRADMAIIGTAALKVWEAEGRAGLEKFFEDILS